MKIKNISREEEEMSRAIDALTNESTTPDIEVRTKTLLVELGLADEIKTTEAVGVDQTDRNTK